MKHSFLPPRTLSSMLLLAAMLALAACGGKKPEPYTRYESVDSPGAATGVGLESQDIKAMTDQMMRDMLANPTLGDSKKSPRVIIDSAYFVNEGSSRLNKNLITDRLRVELNRSAQGRLFFVGREYRNMAEEERQLKREGTMDAGSLHMTARMAGADFRLGGRIATLDAIDPAKGVTSRYHQITFEMIDLETTLIVWSGIYEFKKASQRDIIYQ